jgi:hypothetical protein
MEHEHLVDPLGWQMLSVGVEMVWVLYKKIIIIWCWFGVGGMV